MGFPQPPRAPAPHQRPPHEEKDTAGHQVLYWALLVPAALRGSGISSHFSDQEAELWRIAPLHCVCQRQGQEPHFFLPSPSLHFSEVVSSPFHRCGQES